TLRKNVLDHLAVDVGQPEVAAGMAIRQLLVIEPEQMQDGGLHVVDVDRLVGDVEAEIVGRPVGQPRPHPAAGEPHRVRRRAYVGCAGSQPYRASVSFASCDRSVSSGADVWSLNAIS